MTTAPNIPQDFAAWEALDSSNAVDVPEPAPLPLSAQISLENAARLRYQQRTGKAIRLIEGGETDADALAILCEHCGERPGRAYQVRYTARPVHICKECITQERRYAAALIERYGSLPHVRPVLVLPSSQRQTKPISHQQNRGA